MYCLRFYRFIFKYDAIHSILLIEFSAEFCLSLVCLVSDSLMKIFRFPEKRFNFGHSLELSSIKSFISKLQAILISTVPLYLQSFADWNVL